MKRKLLLAAVLAAVTGMTGCTALQLPPKNDPLFAEKLEQAKREAYTASTLATMAAMSAIKDEPAKRLAGKNINVAAAAVEDTLTQGFTAEALQPLVAQITSQIGGDQQEAAMYANAVLVIIESKLPPFNPDDESARTTATRALLSAIAKGAKDTTASYNPAT